MRRPRLVIADDDTRLLNIVSSLLEQFFEIAGSATDGEAAVDAVIDSDPDVLVVDLSMPLMTGVEVAKCLRQLNHRVRVVLLTVHEGLQDVLRDERFGIHGYVFKRRVGTDLVPAIERVLNGEQFSSRAFDTARCGTCDS